MNVTWCVLSIDVMAAIIRYMDWFSFIDALFSVLSNIHTHSHSEWLNETKPPTFQLTDDLLCLGATTTSNRFPN